MSDISHASFPARPSVLQAPSTPADGKPTGQDAASRGTDVPPRAAPVAPEEISRVVSNLNEYVQAVDRELHFSVDEDSGRTVITVINPATDEVIRQIPPEEVLALAQLIDRDDGPPPGFLVRGEA